jgi:hypothetical protein
MKTIQLNDDDIQALDGDEIERLLERCYKLRAMPRRKDGRDDLFGDLELLHGRLSALRELHGRVRGTPHD